MKYKWVKIAESEAELPEETVFEKEAAGKIICMVRSEGKLYGCAARCPHAGGRMVSGYTDAAGNIVCPLHRYKFSIKDGRNTSGEGYFLQVYPIEIRPGGVFIGLKPNIWG